MAKKTKTTSNGNSQRTVKVACQTSDSLPLEKITPFQGDLKSLSEQEFEKLKKSIIKYGLSFPSFIWRQNGAMKCLDGHQRTRVLGQMKKEGWIIPSIPIVYVDAKNEKEAKEKVLLLSSQYGKYSMDSVYKYLNDGDLDFKALSSVIDLPQFDLGKFEDFYYTNDIQPASAEEQSRLDSKSPVLCPNCGTEFTPK